MSQQKKELSKEELIEKTKQQEPSVEVQLPSGGKVYPEDSPMADGKLSMRYMKGQDEEILISPKYAKSGNTFNVLLRRLIMEANFDPLDLTTADKENLVLSARVVSLGDEFEAENIECNNPNCDHTEPKKIMKLSDIKENPILHEPDELHTNRFSTKLPTSGDKVTLKVLTGRDQKIVNENFENNRVASDGEIMTYSMAQAIVDAPNVDTEQFGHKVRFYKNLPIRDTRHLRNFLSECAGGTDYKVDYTCPECELTQEIQIDFGLGFFF